MSGAGAGAAPSTRSLFAAAGAVVAAFLASLCCIGPVLFVTLGVGAGLASTFEPLRPLFTVLTAGLLAAGFYTVYGRRAASAGTAEECGPDAACAVPRSRTRDKIILWGAAALAIVFWSFIYWSWLLV